MKVEFRASFARDLKRIRDKSLLNQVREAIQQTEAAEDLRNVSNIKKLRAQGNYYRIRLGDYRIGLVIDDIGARFVRFLHRSEIYRYFP
ncbi:MAG: type II toxin-antitoxin system RelE/ParE family toxin [Thermodesulfobacteriota bacterium]